MKTSIVVIVFFASSMLLSVLSQAQVRAPILMLARQIAADSTVDAEFIGRAAVTTEQYRRSVVLLAQASEAELLALTDHSSPAVRCYAYQGLCERKSKALLISLRKHELDTAAVVVNVGCFGLSLTVISSMRQDFMAQQKLLPILLSPADTLLLARLNKAEDDKFELRMKRRRQRLKH